MNKFLNHFKSKFFSRRRSRTTMEQTPRAAPDPQGAAAMDVTSQFATPRPEKRKKKYPFCESPMLDNYTEDEDSELEEKLRLSKTVRAAKMRKTNTSAEKLIAALNNVRLDERGPRLAHKPPETGGNDKKVGEGDEARDTLMESESDNLSAPNTGACASSEVVEPTNQLKDVIRPPVLAITTGHAGTRHMPGLQNLSSDICEVYECHPPSGRMSRLTTRSSQTTIEEAGLDYGYRRHKSGFKEVGTSTDKRLRMSGHILQSEPQQLGQLQEKQGDSSKQCGDVEESMEIVMKNEAASNERN